MRETAIPPKGVPVCVNGFSTLARRVRLLKAAALWTLPVGRLSGAVDSVDQWLNLTGGWPVDVGDLVTVPYEGQPSCGRVEAVAGGRALIRLTVRAPADWTSPLTGGTVPAGCPRTYLLWLPAGD